MKKLCSDEKYACCPVCDFCIHYNYNGKVKDHKRKKGTIYTGEGCCKLHFIREDPDGSCEDFHCQWRKEP